MTEAYRFAYAQVEKIIALLPEKQKSKIPSKTMIFLKENKNDNVIIRKDIPLEDQGITQEAKAIIANLYRDYLAEENERETIRARQNQELSEVFNVENILKNRKKQSGEQLKEYKKSVFETILGKIKGFLHIN